MRHNRPSNDSDCVINSGVVPYLLQPHVMESFTESMVDQYFDWVMDVVKAYKKKCLHSTVVELSRRLTQMERTKTVRFVFNVLLFYSSAFAFPAGLDC